MDEADGVGTDNRCVVVLSNGRQPMDADADHASLHKYHRTPQPVRAAVSVRRSRPPTDHRRAADGDAATTAPPLPDRRAEGGF